MKSILQGVCESIGYKAIEHNQQLAFEVEDAAEFIRKLSLKAASKDMNYTCLLGCFQQMFFDPTSGCVYFTHHKLHK